MVSFSNIKDLKPRASEITLEQVDKKFRLRPVSLDDEIWLSHEFGNRIQDVFEKVQMPEICKIVYRLIEPTDRLFFKKQKVKTVNEEGEEEVVELGGVKLLMALTIGLKEKEMLVRALLETIGMSRRHIEEIEDSFNHEKQNGSKKKRKKKR